MRSDISINKEFLEANKDAFIVLFFDAEFTGQSELVNQALKALDESEDLKGKITLGSVNVEENDELTTELSVLSVPMVVCLLKGKVVRKVDTLEPNKIVNVIKEELEKQTLSVADGPEQQVDPQQRLNDYLKKLVNRSNVMVFMKGDPKAPRCGFSKQLVELLGRHNVKYESFDILQDEEVRQGLKTYSDWPTYPQIYVKGEFVGGLDILKQLEETKELESTLSV